MKGITRIEKTFSIFKEKADFLKEIVDKYCFLLVIIIFAVTFALKFLIASSFTSLSADYGAYLRLADIIRGFDIRGTGLRYLPLFPMMLNVFLFFFDELTALKVCAAFLYSIIAIPFFFLSKNFCKNSILAILASLLIVYNYFYSEMMAWGGNANILSISFMIIFLNFWFNSLKIGGKRNFLLSSIFLSLSIGTHYLSGVYLIVFFIIFLLLLVISYKGQNETKGIIKKTFLVGFVGLILSIPYLSYYAYLLTSPIIHETAFSVATSFTLTDAIYILNKNFINILLTLIGIFGIISLIKEDKLKGIIAAALFISSCLLLFTQNSVRWLYFWPIPIFLGLISLINCVAHAKRFLMKRDNLKILIIGGLLFIICINMLNSVYYLQNACSYYNALSENALEALKWIRNINNTSSDSIIATSGPFKKGCDGMGSIYGWWIEGYSDRRCIAPSYLRFLIYQDERELAMNANIIFSGTNVIVNDYIMVAETIYAKWGNPEIGVNIGDFYEKVLFFADNETIITYQKNYDSLLINASLSDMKCKKIEALQLKNRTELAIIYSSEDGLLNVTKRISVSKLSSSTSVSFNIQCKENLTRAMISILRSDFVGFENYDKISNKSIRLHLITPMNIHLKAELSVEYDGKVETYFPEQHKSDDRALVTFIFSNLPKYCQINFKLTLPKLIESHLNSVEYYDTYELIEQLGIDYILVNKNRVREFEWLSSDSKHFQRVYENKEIAIFKVTF